MKYASPRPGCTSSVSSMLAEECDYIKGIFVTHKRKVGAVCVGLKSDV